MALLLLLLVVVSLALGGGGGYVARAAVWVTYEPFEDDQCQNQTAGWTQGSLALKTNQCLPSTVGSPDSVMARCDNSSGTVRLFSTGFHNSLTCDNATATAVQQANQTFPCFAPTTGQSTPYFTIGCREFDNVVLVNYIPGKTCSHPSATTATFPKSHTIPFNTCTQSMTNPRMVNARAGNGEYESYMVTKIKHKNAFVFKSYANANCTGEPQMVTEGTNGTCAEYQVEGLTTASYVFELYDQLIEDVGKPSGAAAAVAGSSSIVLAAALAMLLLS